MPNIGTLNPPPNIAHALRQAAVKTGVDFDYLLRTAKRESAFKSHVKSKTSSATGLFQFLDQTWLGMVKKAGPGLGLGLQANAIKQTSPGRFEIADPKLRSAILALRKDPKTASIMAGAFTKQNAQSLQQSLGRAPKQGELYIAHFLGVKGATKLIKTAESAPKTIAATIAPLAAKANKPIFYTKAGKPLSVAQVYQGLTRTFNAKSTTPGLAVFMAANKRLPAPVAALPNMAKVQIPPSAAELIGPPEPLPNFDPAKPGGMFAVLYGRGSRVNSSLKPTELTSEQLDILQTLDPPQKAKKRATPAQNPSNRLSGTRPLLHSLFTTAKPKPLL